VCKKKQPWGPGWRHIFCPSAIDGEFPTKFCSDECEKRWFEQKQDEHTVRLPCVAVPKIRGKRG
jgi:hypothetical protein